MPTIHNTNRKILKKNNLQSLPWSIGDLSGLDRSASDNDDSESCNSKQNRNNHIDDDDTNTNNTSSRKRPCKSPSVIPSNLKRISDEIIWIQEGKAQHPAYILQDCTNTQSNDILFMSSNTVWVEWVSNGKKESIYKHQIVQDGLQARKRHRPDYFTEDPSDKSASTTDALNNKKKARNNSPREDREIPPPPVVATAKSTSISLLNRDGSIVLKKKSPRCKGKSILEGLDGDSITQKDNREENQTTQSTGSKKPQSLHSQLMETVDKKLQEADNLAMMQKIWNQRKQSHSPSANEKPEEAHEPPKFIRQQKDPSRISGSDDHRQALRVAATAAGLDVQPATSIQQQAVQQDRGAVPNPLSDGGWRGDWDKEVRRQMIANIMKLLIQRRPNAPPEWHEKLPQMAKQLEGSLYYEAPSFEFYNDASTLNKRLESLAADIRMKTKQMQTKQNKNPQGIRHIPTRNKQQQPAAQQQSQPMPSILNGGWQSDEDMEDRRRMITNIMNHCRQRKPDPSKEWLSKLPQLAHKLEESLYRSAPSFKAYNDISTLKQRLEQLAINVGMKTKRIQQTGQQPGGQAAQPSAHQQSEEVLKMKTKKKLSSIAARAMAALEDEDDSIELSSNDDDDEPPSRCQVPTDTLKGQSHAEQQQQKWDDMFQCLLSFIEETRKEMTKDMNDEEKKASMWNGTVPQRYKTPSGKPLGPWVSKQRTAKKNGTLKEDREVRLTNIGFRWSVESQEVRQQHWEEMFKCLLDYIEETRKEETQDMNDEEKAAWAWDGLVPAKYKTPSGKNLGPWVSNQRAAKKKGELKDDREARLVSTGLNLEMQGGKEHLQQLWEDMFQCLLDFIKETREEETRDMNDKEKAAWVWSGNVPTNYKTASGKLLGSWINTQRVAKRRGTLKEDREARLASTGLTWDVHTNNVTAQTGKNEEVRQQKWERMFQCLLHYIEETRKEETTNMNDEQKAAWAWDGEIPYNYTTPSGINLGTWIGTQREAKKKGTMKDNREARLISTGLNLEVQGKEKWDDMFQCLLDFIEETRKEEKKDMNDEEKAAWVWDGQISSKYTTPSGKNLGLWVSAQRKAKRDGNLKEDREARLVRTGLNLEMQGGKEHLQQLWEDMFQCLLIYIEESRKEETKDMNDEQKAAWVWDGNVPTNYKTASGKLLGSWINTQRVAKRRGTLLEDREARLTNIGLRWKIYSVLDTTSAAQSQPAACPPSSSNDMLQRKMANARGKGLGLSLLVPLEGSVSRMKNSAAESHQPPYNGITQPGNNDCLFGREKWIYNHPGNKRYQQIIEENRLIYQVISKNEKKTLRMKIVNDWRENNGGRFLKLNKTKMWEDIGDDKAQQYISLALREEDSTLMEAVATESKQSSRVGP